MNALQFIGNINTDILDRAVGLVHDAAEFFKIRGGNSHRIERGRSLG